MTDEPKLVDVNAASFDTLRCCGIKAATHPGRKQKQCWLQANARLGLRARALLAPDGQACGYIEYLPGEYAWRAVDACGYMFIHCVWIYSKQHQGKGWAGLMLQECIENAQKAGMSGVAVLTREGPWMADSRLFLPNGFESIDTTPPDYRLLVRKFSKDATNPAIKRDCDREVAKYSRGLTIVRSNQCPYVEKFSTEIVEAAEKEFHMRPTVVDLKSHGEAQAAPTPYASFALIYNGRLLADHQVSCTRFRNIMKKCAV